MVSAGWRTITGCGSLMTAGGRWGLWGPTRGGATTGAWWPGGTRGSRRLVGLRGVSTLGSFVDRVAPGRRPQFVEAHIVKALKLIGAEGPGREHLAGRLGLGEGVVRTLLGRLMAGGFVSPRGSGR